MAEFPLTSPHVRSGQFPPVLLRVLLGSHLAFQVRSAQFLTSPLSRVSGTGTADQIVTPSMEVAF